LTTNGKADGPVDLTWIKDQINDLRGQVRAHEARLHMLGLAGDGNPIEQLAELAVKVELLEATLTAAINGEKIKGPPAIDWPRIPDDRYRAELAKLAEWVSTIVANYYPAWLPLPCWQAHPDVVIQLSLIHAEWRRIYDVEEPKLLDALGLMDRWWPNAVRRIRELCPECSSDYCSRKAR
jgi:hypothetical protein